MNRTLSLIRYAKLDKGWRRGAVVMQPNGRIKHPYVVFGGAEVAAPQGRYQIVRYVGRQAQYTDLGDNPTEALNRLKVEQAKQEARELAIEAATAAGLTIAETVRPKPEPGKKPHRTLKEWAEAFLAKHRRQTHRTDDAVRVYTAITSSFLAVCESGGHHLAKAKYPDELTEEHVTEWHARLREKLSDRTCADRYISLRAFLRYCGVDVKALIPEGTHKMLIRYTEKEPNAYEPEQVQALINASLDEYEALRWEFAYKTGLRESELKMATRYDLHNLNGSGDGPMLHVKERDQFGKIKNSKERKIELEPALVTKLQAWLKANPKKVLLFGTSEDTPDIHMLRTLKRTARRGGLNCGLCKGCLGKHKECREFTLHRFRRTFTTRLLRATKGDLRTVMKRTGHKDIATVMLYLAPAESARQAIAVAF